MLGLAGGPGQAALPLVGDFAEQLAPALATRDLLIFDQRGTGASSSVTLPAERRLADRRRHALRRRARPRAAGPSAAADTVEDIEVLRAESGYEQLVIYAVSYGTKVALDYAARYPARVAALVLDSVVLPQGPDPLQRSTFASMRRVLAELCSGGACRGISGNPVGDLAGRVRGLGRKPLRGLLTSARGVRQRVFIERRDLFDIMLTGDLNPTLRAELPGALTSARRGDAAPLIRLAARSAGIISFQGRQYRVQRRGLRRDPLRGEPLSVGPRGRTAGALAADQRGRARRRRRRVQPVRPHDGADERGRLAVRRLAGRVAAPRVRGPAAERADARHQRRDGRPHAARGRRSRQGP